MKQFHALCLLNIVFIMLINVKMSTIVGIFNIYEQDKFCAQLSWAWKKFYNLGARPLFHLKMCTHLGRIISQASRSLSTDFQLTITQLISPLCCSVTATGWHKVQTRLTCSLRCTMIRVCTSFLESFCQIQLTLVSSKVHEQHFRWVMTGSIWARMSNKSSKSLSNSFQGLKVNEKYWFKCSNSTSEMLDWDNQDISTGKISIKLLCLYLMRHMLHQIKAQQFCTDSGRLSTVLSPTENSRIQGLFKAFEWFPVFFKANLISKDF